MNKIMAAALAGLITFAGCRVVEVENRGEEIAPDVLEAHADEIFDEAENRIYVEKAVLAVLLAGK